MLTTRAPGRGVTSIEPAVALDLQPADVVLVHEREEPGVAVGADALAGAVGPGRGGIARGEVADHLEQHLGRRDGGVERRGRQLEGDGQGPQERVTEQLEVLHPRRRQGAQLGDGGRPQVRATQAQPRRFVRAQGAGGQLAADVELIAQVDLAVGALVAEAGVAAELGRADVLDGQPLLVGEGEEATGHGVEVGGEAVGDAVPDHVEEPDLVDRPTEGGDEGGSGSR